MRLGSMRDCLTNYLKVLLGEAAMRVVYPEYMLFLSFVMHHFPVRSLY